MELRQRRTLRFEVRVHRAKEFAVIQQCFALLSDPRCKRPERLLDRLLYLIDALVDTVGRLPSVVKLGLKHLLGVHHFAAERLEHLRHCQRP